MKTTSQRLAFAQAWMYAKQNKPVKLYRDGCFWHVNLIGE